MVDFAERTVACFREDEDYGFFLIFRACRQHYRQTPDGPRPLRLAIATKSELVDTEDKELVKVVRAADDYSRGRGDKSGSLRRAADRVFNRIQGRRKRFDISMVFTIMDLIVSIIDRIREKQESAATT